MTTEQCNCYAVIDIPETCVFSDLNTDSLIEAFLFYYVVLGEIILFHRIRLLFVCNSSTSVLLNIVSYRPEYVSTSNFHYSRFPIFSESYK